MGKADIKKMFELFEEYSHCIYKVKLIKEYLPENYNKEIIHVSEENIPQQELLCNYLKIKSPDKLPKEKIFYPSNLKFSKKF